MALTRRFIIFLAAIAVVHFSTRCQSLRLSKSFEPATLQGVCHDDCEEIQNCKRAPNSSVYGVKGGAISRKKSKGKRKRDETIELKVPKKDIHLFVPIIAAMNYYLSLSLVIPVLPKIVNEIVSGKQGVTARSAPLYGMLSGIDGLFTFLTVNAAGSLSDKFGRKPFMFLASIGLGTGFILSSQASKVWMLVLASIVDGCTSCMYAIANSYVADIVEPAKLPQAFGYFQGIALGLSFMIGIPLGGIIGAKTNIRVPLYIAATLCALNALWVLIIPESVPTQLQKMKKVNLANANPWGAMKMLGENKLLASTAAAYFMVWLAHASLQINWVNFTQYKFDWNVAQSGLSLCLMGILVAVTPKLVTPHLGVKNSMGIGILLLSFSNFFLALAPAGWMLILGLGVLGVGSIVFPATLSFLTQQVDDSEVGAMQGAADTVKTLTTTLAAPLASMLFGYSISDKAPTKAPGAFMIVGGFFLLAAYALLNGAISKHGHLSKC